MVTLMEVVGLFGRLLLLLFSLEQAIAKSKMAVESRGIRRRIGKKDYWFRFLQSSDIAKPLSMTWVTQRQKDASAENSKYAGH
jgi:hypothetical protein